ncbi:hypothetical protein HDV00_003143 [Rhizophlyctis rosea]|nr:hypothetical protein HDV00_003143 [Rhizophlyctis rosea]
MNPDVYNDIHASGTKVVLIVLTAGDSGKTNGWWQAREKASVASTQFAVDSSVTAAASLAPTTVSADNFTVCYSSNNYQSLAKFRSAQIKNITTVDKSTTYTSYNDLLDTLGAILKTEMKGVKNGTLHVQDENRNVNTGDHGDHIAASLIVQDARRRSGLGCLGVYQYLDYVTASRTPNIVTSATSASSGYGNLIAKAATWGVLSSTLEANGFASDFTGSPSTTYSHTAWIARQYVSGGSRKVEPSGACNVV